MSLDGYIAGPNGQADWITIDPEFDFSEVFASSIPCWWAAAHSTPWWQRGALRFRV